MSKSRSSVQDPFLSNFSNLLILTKLQVNCFYLNNIQGRNVHFHIIHLILSEQMTFTSLTKKHALCLIILLYNAHLLVSNIKVILSISLVKSKMRTRTHT